MKNGDNENKIIDFAEFLKEKARTEGDLKPQELKLAEFAIDAVANALIGVINLEHHTDRIATALEQQVKLYKRSMGLNALDDGK